MRWSRLIRHRRVRRAREGAAPSASSAPLTSGRVTRDVVGPTGWMWSNAWDQLDKHGEAYRKSFDRRLPPSLFVSERDRQRAGQPMPLAERCIEDYHSRRSQTGDSTNDDSASGDSASDEHE